MKYPAAVSSGRSTRILLPPRLCIIAAICWGLTPPAAAFWGSSLPESLVSSDEKARANALAKLDRLSPEKRAAVVYTPGEPDLCERLISGDADVRERAREAIKQAGPDGAMAMVRCVINIPTVREGMTKGAAVAELSGIRTIAAELLAGYGTAAAEPLKVGLRSKDVDAFSWGCFLDALHQMGPAATPVAEHFAEQLKSDEFYRFGTQAPHYMEPTFAVLGAIGPAAKPAADQLLRYAAAPAAQDALIKIGSGAVEALAAKLDAPEREWRDMARQLLARMDPTVLDGFPNVKRKIEAAEAADNAADNASARLAAAKAAKVEQDKKDFKERIRKLRAKYGPTKYEVPEFAYKYAREDRFLIIIGVNIVRDPETGDAQRMQREICYAPNSETMDCTCAPGKKQRFVREGRSMVYSNGIERSFVCK